MKPSPIRGVRDRGRRHDGYVLIIDKAGVDYVVGVRSHTGEVLTVYLMDADVKKIVEFCSREPD
jgi:hypothetical protein